MNRKKRDIGRRTVVWAAAVLLLNAVPSPLRADSGATTGNIMKLSLSPRAVGMGEAFSAVGGGIDSLSINPAGLSAMSSHEFKAMHARLASGMRQDDFAYGLPTRWGSFAGEYMSFGSGPVDAYDASDNPVGTVKVQDQLFRLAYARDIMGTLSVGISVARLQENLAGVKAKTDLADFGVRGRILGDRLSLGLAYKNLGRGLKFDSASDPLPRTVVWGAAWEQRLLPFSKLLLGADMFKPHDRSIHSHVGAELWFYDVLVLRGGYLTEQDIGSGIRMGAGLRWKNIGADYALASLGELGDAHRISVSVRFGPRFIKRRSDPATTQRHGSDALNADADVRNAVASPSPVKTAAPPQGTAPARTPRRNHRAARPGTTPASLKQIETSAASIRIKLTAPVRFNTMFSGGTKWLLIDLLNTVDDSGDHYGLGGDGELSPVRAELHQEKPFPITRIIAVIPSKGYRSDWEGSTLVITWTNGEAASEGAK